jgi:hypothetical protein
MSNVPEGAQLSEDGHWYWDGAAWQPVGDGAGSDAPSSSASEGAPDTTKRAPEIAFDAEVGDEAELPDVEELA